MLLERGQLAPRVEAKSNSRSELTTFPDCHGEPFRPRPALPDGEGSQQGNAMSAREVVFLGTASQVPTRSRNHNALMLLWDDLGILFDPGEGTQRQMTLAGLSAS